MGVPDAGYGGEAGVLMALVVFGRGGVLMADSHASCYGGVEALVHTLVVGGGEEMVLMAVSDAGSGGRGGGSQGSPRCWLRGRGEAGVLMAVPIAGCGGRRGLSWQSQMQVVGWRHGESQRLFVLGEEGFSRQSQTLVLRGRGRFLMAVPDACCGC